MHAKFDEFGVLARLFVPDLVGPRALPIASSEPAAGSAGLGGSVQDAFSRADGDEVRHDRQD
jgi:hypothetical protein